MTKRSSVSSRTARQLREVALSDALLRVPILLLRRQAKRFSPLQENLQAAIRAHFAAEATSA